MPDNKAAREPVAEAQSAEIAPYWLAAIIESADDAIVSKTLDGIITSWNKGAERLFGYKAEEVIGKSVTILIPPDHQDEESNILARIRTGERIENYETVRIKKDGRPIDVSLTVSPIRGVKGNIIGASKIARDITGRKQAEARLKKALLRAQEAGKQIEETSRLKDEFLATVSHELRTPMTAIVGWAHLLRTGLLDQASSERALETIERNAQSQTQLINDLLDISRIIAGKLRLDVRPVEIARVIEAAVDAVRPAAAAKKIELQTGLDAEAGVVSADPERLQQVAWNLLSNAIKFTPPGGRVSVRLARVDSHVEIIVGDTGEGISPEFLPFVFDRFRQADGSITRAHGGLGLGLAITRHLVEMHGGTVTATSLGKGRGATFTVKLPLFQLRNSDCGLRIYKEAVFHSAIRNPNSAILRGLRVLLVEDDLDAQELFAAALKQYEAEVTAVASASLALDALRQSKIDVLVSDIQMPEMDGYELICKVRALGAEGARKIPALALTAYARAEDRTQSFRAGYQAHLSKPVEPTELVAMVAALAGRTGQV